MSRSSQLKRRAYTPCVACRIRSLRTLARCIVPCWKLFAFLTLFARVRGQWIEETSNLWWARTEVTTSQGSAGINEQSSQLRMRSISTFWVLSEGAMR